MFDMGVRENLGTRLHSFTPTLNTRLIERAAVHIINILFIDNLFNFLNVTPHTNTMH